MKTTGTVLRRNIQFYTAYAKAKLLKKKTFTYNKSTYSTKDKQVESDFIYDVENGLLDIKLA